MPSIRLLVAGCFALLLGASTVRADAKDDAQKALLGKWSLSQKKGDIEITGHIEFTKDGKLNMKMKVMGMDFAIDGTYKLLSDTEMETTITFMGNTKSDKGKFKVNQDTLELTDKDGKVEKLTRIK